MHVLALDGNEPLRLDGIHRGGGGAVEQDRRRLARLDPQVDGNRVAVVGPDAPVLVAGEALPG